MERIEITEAKDGSWRWSYYSVGGHCIAISAIGYSSKAGCITGLVSARKGLPRAKAFLTTSPPTEKQRKKKEPKSVGIELPPEPTEPNVLQTDSPDDAGDSSSDPAN